MRTIQLDERGKLEASPGSRPWAIAIRDEINTALHNVEFSADTLKAYVELMQHHKGYQALGFSNFDEFCAAPIGKLGLNKTRINIQIEIDQRRIAQQHAKNAQPLAKHGGDRTNKQDNNYNVAPAVQGTDPTYLTARIARDRPDILDGMKRGEYRSVRQAAIAAGIAKDVKRISCKYDVNSVVSMIMSRFDNEEICEIRKALT